MRSSSSPLRSLTLLGLLGALTGCTIPDTTTLSAGVGSGDQGDGSGGDDGGTDDTGNPAAQPAYATSTRADLRVKRWRQLSLDLQGALELAEDEVCKEIDRFQCTSMHVVQLGGISDDNGVYQPQEQLSVTAGLATERVVLQACTHRMEADREADEPVVFGHVDLEGDTLEAAEAEAQSTELWRRLLARDPSPEELTGAMELHTSVLASGGDNAAWAVMLCFALGTSTEALTY